VIDMNNVLKLCTFLLAIAVSQLLYAGSHGGKPREGMTLDNSLSSLNFVSVKKGSVGEVHTIDKLSGSLSDDGNLVVKLDLSSVNTGIDIRNERMLEHLFETKNNPIATISAKISGGRSTNEISTITGTLSLDLHGIKKDIEFNVVAVKSGDNLVVSSAKPIIIQASDFGLVAGIQKLQELAKLPSIATAVPVNFVLVFKK